MSRRSAVLFALSAACVTMPAIAPSDYLLQLPPVKGEISPPIVIDSWSFGVCNPGQCAAGSAAKAGKPSSASWDLATGKGGRMAAGGGGGSKVQSGISQTGGALASGAAVVAGDVDGDGSPDLAFAGTQDEIYGLTFTVDASAPNVAAACASGHIEKATLSNGTDTFAVSSVSAVCSKGGSGAAAASYARSGINRIDSTPARISTNLTVGKQTQGATFGEKANQGLASGSGAITMTITGEQMKHTKTGHVTLLK